MLLTSSRCELMSLAFAVSSRVCCMAEVATVYLVCCPRCLHSEKTAPSISWRERLTVIAAGDDNERVKLRG
jgi:hypothetical protein